MISSVGKDRPMISGYSSIFLDALRLLAALVVVFVHANNQWLTVDGQGYDISHLGHTAVIIFFVLSGFVISFTCHTKNRGWKQYLQSRLSRLYSMLIPALLFSALVEILIYHIDFTIYTEYTRGESLPRYLFSMFFLSEYGLSSVAPPINRPLWSLSYEFWYYIIFGLYFFLKRGWKAYLYILFACLVAGPKILIMMPIWLAGSYAYSEHREIKNTRLAWILVIISILLSVGISFILPSLPFSLGKQPMYYSNQFLTDYFIGFFICFGLMIMPMNSFSIVSKRYVSMFRRLGDLTFPIYVLHHPLLILWRSIFNSKINDRADMYTALLFTLLISSFLGIFLDKQRALYSKFLKW